MRIVQINMLHNGSTGKIMLNIADCARQIGHEVWTFSPIVHYLHSIMETPAIEGHSYFGTRSENMIHRIFDRALCVNGMFSFFGTRKLLRALKVIKPDIIHLHNLHNLTIDLRSLFEYIKKNNIKVIWTLHDCWAFTGRCPHFEMVGCENWKTGCGNCSQLERDPKAYIDSTRLMWRLKRSWFSSVKTMIITSPSQWLADKIKQSYMGNYVVHVIHNGVDLSIFKPVNSQLRVRWGCENKKIILGVAFDWDQYKGLDVFVELARRIPTNYRIVLVGTNEAVEAQLPKSITTIRRTQNQQELAEIYTAADVFVNPTREEVLGMVNIEALACGTPVVTFATGGSPETLDQTCGVVVPYNDIDAMERAIYRVCESNLFSQQACVARAQCFNQQEKFQEYIDLYEQFMVK